MRIQTLVLCLLLCVASAFAKDVITKTDGTKLDAKVVEITETVIKYRKVSNPTGPIYTIPITSVATVLYENGAIDTFNKPESTSVTEPSKSALSDDELMRMADHDSQFYSNHSGNLSDSELIKMIQSNSYEDLLKKSNTFKKIGLYGGGSLLIVGVGLGIVCAIFENYEGFAIGCGLGLVAGGLWYWGFTQKANSLMKQAKQMQSYSATLIENNILKFGDNSLIAGINLMGNRMVHSHSLGVSLGLTF